MIIHDYEQGTDEWRLVRMGKATASCFGKAIAKPKTKGGVAKTSRDYMIQLVAERLSGIPQNGFTNSAMQWGTETEPFARACYEETNGVKVSQIGFAERDEYIGASPDGLIGTDGMLEIKCPNTATHLTYILDNKLPSTYKPQVQGQLWICERDWCDFVSFDPRIQSQRFFCKRIYRDDKYIEELAEKIDLFVHGLIEMIGQFPENPY